MTDASPARRARVADRARSGHASPTRIDVLIVPAAIRMAQMVVQLLVLAALNSGTGHSLFSRLTVWDSQIYAEIATAGYPGTLRYDARGALVDGTQLAFHPLYPGVVAGVHLITRIPVLASSVMISMLAGLVAAVLICQVVLDRGGSRRTAYLASALLGVQPMALALQMGYAESLLTALTAGTVLAAGRRRWWLAGILACAAGLTRPVGLIAAAAIALIAFAGSHDERADALRRKGTVIGAMVLGVIGAPAFWLFVAWRTSRLTGWFLVERDGWQTHFDAGAQAYRFVSATLAHPDGFLGPAVTVIILGYLAVLVATARRDGFPLFALGLLGVASALLSTNYWHSRPRLLLTAFLLVVPVALGMRRLGTRGVLVLVVAGSLAAAWFGAYMVDQFRYAI